MANCLVELPAGIPVLSYSRIQIVPNPARNQFRLTGVDEAHVQVFNLSGQLIIDIQNYDEGQAISTSGWKPGLYLVKLTTKDYTSTIKLIQQ